MFNRIFLHSLIIILSLICTYIVYIYLNYTIIDTEILEKFYTASATETLLARAKDECASDKKANTKGFCSNTLSNIDTYNRYKNRDSPNYIALAKEKEIQKYTEHIYNRPTESPETTPETTSGTTSGTTETFSTIEKFYTTTQPATTQPTTTPSPEWPVLNYCDYTDTTKNYSTMRPTETLAPIPTGASAICT